MIYALTFKTTSPPLAISTHSNHILICNLHSPIGKGRDESCLEKWLILDQRQRKYNYKPRLLYESEIMENFKTRE